jgi:FtsH-binding integral membrane protein
MAVDAGLRAFMLGVYNKMALGLALTAGLAWVVGTTPALVAAIFSGPQAYLVMFGPLAILLIASFTMRNPSPVSANLVYWSVVALIGVGMGALVYAYARIPDGMVIVAKAFLVTSAAFGGLSLWGYTTKRDLTGFEIYQSLVFLARAYPKRPFPGPLNRTLNPALRRNRPFFD